MLNLLQRACGIADRHPAPTWTPSPAPPAASSTPARRRPGLRALDIAAVLAGGGSAPSRRPEPRGDGQGQSLAGAPSASGGDPRRRAGRRASRRDHGAVRGGRVVRSSWRRRARPGPPGCWWTTRRRTRVRRWAGGRGGSRPGSRSRRPAGSRWRTCGRTRRRGRTSCRWGADAQCAGGGPGGRGAGVAGSAVARAASLLRLARPAAVGDRVSRVPPPRRAST